MEASDPGKEKRRVSTLVVYKSFFPVLNIHGLNLVAWLSRFPSFPVFQKRPFVHNSVCSQFLEGLFAILAECSQFCLRAF